MKKEKKGERFQRRLEVLESCVADLQAETSTHSRDCGDFKNRARVLIAEARVGFAEDMQMYLIKFQERKLTEEEKVAVVADPPPGRGMIFDD